MDRRITLALVLAGMATVHAAHAETEDDNNFRKDVVLCEDALARLASCCPERAF